MLRQESSDFIAQAIALKQKFIVLKIKMIPYKEIRVFKYLLQYRNLFSLTVLPCLFVSISHFLLLIAVMDFFQENPAKGFVHQFVNCLNFKPCHVTILGDSHIPFASLIMSFVVILLAFTLLF